MTEQTLDPKVQQGLERLARMWEMAEANKDSVRAGLSSLTETSASKDLETAWKHFELATGHLRAAIEKIMKDTPSSVIDIWANDFAKALVSDAPPNGDQMPRSILALDPETSKKALTPGRLDLMGILAGGDIKTVGELAKAAKKPLSLVSRELKVLENFGFVKLVRKGKNKMPVLLTNRISIQLEGRT